jgi:glycerol kinase
LLQAKVVRPVITETTALGAAYLAGLAVKYWNDIKEVVNQWQVESTFSPKISVSDTLIFIDGWHRAIKAAKAWTDLK